MHRTALTERYLEALNVAAAPASFELLSTLITKHIATLSFSSIGVRLQDSLPLDLPAIFDRIVIERRGGYCFEQNALLFEVLQELGFDVDIKLARVIYGRDYLPGLTHRITIVTLDQRPYVVDVGFGPNGPATPVPLFEEQSEDTEWKHRVHEFREGEYHMQSHKPDGPYSLYRFDLGQYGPSDCEIAHFYSQHHPDATFVNNLVVSRILDDEIHSLRNRTFIRIHPAGEDVTTVNTSHQLHNLLRDEFGIKVSEAESHRLFSELST